MISRVVGYRRLTFVLILITLTVTSSSAMTPARLARFCGGTIAAASRKIPKRFSVATFLAGIGIAALSFNYYLRSGHEIELNPTAYEQALMAERLDTLSFPEIENRLPASVSLYVRSIEAQDSQLWHNGDGTGFYTPYRAAVRRSLISMLWFYHYENDHSFSPEVFRALSQKAKRLNLPFPDEALVLTTDDRGRPQYIGPPAHEAGELFAGLFDRATESDIEALMLTAVRANFYQMARREFARNVLGNADLAKSSFTPEQEKMFSERLKKKNFGLWRENYLCSEPDRKPRRFGELFNYFQFGYRLEARIPGSADQRRKQIEDWFKRRF